MLQTSILDQIFSNHECIIGEVNLTAPLGKSDHACIEIETNLKCDTEYINSKQRNWSRVTEPFVLERGNNIDWSYSSVTNLGVQEMWDELNTNVQSIINDVPETVMKISCFFL